MREIYVKSVNCVSYISSKTNVKYKLIEDGEGGNFFIVPVDGANEVHYKKYKSELSKREDGDLQTNLITHQKWAREYSNMIKELKRSKRDV